MSTLVLNAYSKAYPFITNRIRASIFLQSDPQALIASIIDTTAGHPQRTWSFPGLPRDNYGFSLDEIDGGGSPINNLALFDVVPGELDGELCRDDEQIRVGETTGFDAGNNSFVFDGTGGKPNYIGWEIVPSELTGRGILIKMNATDYTWDKDTGTFQLTQTGDVFSNGTYYNIHFNSINQPAGNSYPTITDFGIVLVTTDTLLDTTYFGKKIIVEPASELIELTLPDILTVPQGRRIMIEVGNVGNTCVKFKMTGSTPVVWLRGNIYMKPNESLSIYRFRRSLGVDEWRVDNADGNFKTVGQCVGDDAVSADVFNKHLLDGTALSIKSDARLYNEVVLNLPGAQVVDYDVWSTGNNKYLYSKANSSDPGNLDKFHIPDRRGLFEKNNNSGKAGDFKTDVIKEQTISISLPLVQHTTSAPTFGVTDGPLGSPPTKPFNIVIGNTGETETQPKNTLINKYVLL